MRLPKMFFSKIIVFLIFSLFLSSCITFASADIELDIGSNENWDLTYTFTITDVESQAFDAIIAETLNEFVAQVRSEGSEGEWLKLERTSEGLVPYKISVSGQGFNKLPLDQDHILTVDETKTPRQITFRYRLDSELIGLAQNTSFVLRAGKILDSNATEQKANQAAWINHTGMMEAVFVESTPNQLVSILVALPVVGGILFFIFRKQKSGSRTSTQNATYLDQDNTISPIRIENAHSIGEFCSFCGAKLPAAASFCPSCGKNRK